VGSPRARAGDGTDSSCAQVGKEFSSVEALWSQFENVMATEPEEERQARGEDVGRQQGEEGAAGGEPKAKAGER
jgi:DASH complex subunit DAD1